VDSVSDRDLAEQILRAEAGNCPVSDTFKP
jgi:hypothetical protein